MADNTLYEELKARILSIRDAESEGSVTNVMVADILEQLALNSQGKLALAQQILDDPDLAVSGPAVKNFVNSLIEQQLSDSTGKIPSSKAVKEYVRTEAVHKIETIANSLGFGTEEEKWNFGTKNLQTYLNAMANYLGKPSFTSTWPADTLYSWVMSLKQWTNLTTEDSGEFAGESFYEQFTALKERVDTLGAGSGGGGGLTAEDVQTINQLKNWTGLKYADYEPGKDLYSLIYDLDNLITTLRIYTGFHEEDSTNPPSKFTPLTDTIKGLEADVSSKVSGLGLMSWDGTEITKIVDSNDNKHGSNIIYFAPGNGISLTTDYQGKGHFVKISVNEETLTTMGFIKQGTDWRLESSGNITQVYKAGSNESYPWFQIVTYDGQPLLRIKGYGNHEVCIGNCDADEKLNVAGNVKADNVAVPIEVSDPRQIIREVKAPYLETPIFYKGEYIGTVKGFNNGEYTTLILETMRVINYDVSKDDFFTQNGAGEFIYKYFARIYAPNTFTDWKLLSKTPLVELDEDYEDFNVKIKNKE